VLHIDENLLAIDEEIDKLAEEILNSQQVRHYRQSRQAFRNDENLQDELAILNENLAYLNFRPDLRDLQKKINLNPKVYALRLAENDLQELLSELTKSLTASVSEHITIDENLPLKGGGHHQRRKSH
jgi:cell fate (sporulation/competence/biofilm development) regulator YlbF (YheA/YmcA/DUF963 family)